MSSNENITTWSEATADLTNNERGVLWSLIHRGEYHNRYAVKRTTSAADDVRGWRDGTSVEDRKQLHKALLGLEAKGLVTIAPRTGVMEGTRYGLGYDWRCERNGTPKWFYYRDAEYAKWRNDPTRSRAKWFQVAHVTVPKANALRDAINREKSGVTAEQERQVYESAKRSLQREREDAAKFMALINEYADKYGDGTLPLEDADYSGLLSRIESQAKGMAHWIRYRRNDAINEVAAYESEAVAA